jgi:hypothetical protein
MRSHTFALLTALALVLVTAGEANPAGSLPDEIVFHDSNLAITDVSAPRLALTGKQFTVDVEVTETTGNAGASTQVDLLGGESPLRSQEHVGDVGAELGDVDLGAGAVVVAGIG